jgi:hypothetical protein
MLLHVKFSIGEAATSFKHKRTASEVCYSDPDQIVNK